MGEIASGIVASGVFESIASSAQRAFTDSIRAASDLEQAMGGTEAVFGDAADVIDEFAQRSADAVGLSEREFRQATTQIGGQLKRMTGDVDLAAEQSIRLTQVAADLAAMYGGTTAQAVEALGSAFRGEADPAERFNLNLRASVVNAKAVELGLAGSTSAVDEQARAQAILALVTEQSADAQDRFAQEADTAAGAQQRMNARIEDAQAEFGEALLPVLSTAAGLLTDVLAGFQALPGPVQATIGVVTTLAVVAASAAVALRALGVSMEFVKRALGPIGIAAAVMGAALAGLGALGHRTREASAEQKELADQLHETGGEIDAQTRKLAAQALEQSGLLSQAEELGLSTERLTVALAGNEGAWAAVQERLAQVIDEGTEMVATARGIEPRLTASARAALEFRDALEEQRGALEGERAALERVEAAAGRTEVSQEQLAAAIEEAEAAAKRASDEIDRLKDTLFATAQESIALEERQDQLADAIDRAKGASDDDEATKRDQRAALRNVASASHDLIGAMVDQGAETDDVREKTEKARQKFIDVATEMLGDAEAAEALADKYGLIPSEVATTVELIGDQRALERVAAIREQLAILDGDSAEYTITETRQINTFFSTFGSQGISGQRGKAAGGIVGADSPTSSRRTIDLLTGATA